MDYILQTIELYASYALTDINSIKDSDYEVPTITFQHPHVILTLNIRKVNQQLRVWGRYDSRRDSYEYDIIYTPNGVNLQVIELSGEGWNEIDDLSFFEEFIPEMNDYIMEFNLVNWYSDIS
jgi:hypothetical protein